MKDLFIFLLGIWIGGLFATVSMCIFNISSKSDDTEKRKD